MKRILQIFATITYIVICTCAHAQVLTVKFTGRDQTGQHYVKLDHVKTFNLDQLWEEVLYFPDTTLVLGGVGIIDYGNSATSQLEQNVPNPFDGTTNFTLYLREGADILLEIFDLMGKSVVNQHYTDLSAGAHLFSANLTNPQVYILKVTAKKEQMHLKMVNKGYGAENSIRYLSTSTKNGEFESGAKDSQTMGIYPFQNGDELQHTGYTIINGVEYKSETITQQQNESETLTFHFNFTLPTVATSAISPIDSSSIQCGGNVTSDGGLSVTARGVCWNTLSNPTINDNHTIDGSGIGGFTSSIIDLAPGVTYYIRAYATNGAGTVYGEQRSYSTQPILPTVTTSAVSNITATSATCGGNVTSTGGAAVYSRGICWSTSPNPTIADNHITDGSGIGNFIISLTNLSPGTTYYVRAFATNSVGTAYGEQSIFTTLTTLPTVTTLAVNNITTSSASCGGNVTDAGGAVVTARGVCWNTSPNPTINDSHTSDGSGIGNFTSNITGLSLVTTYYVRAYATNSMGTSYGNEIVFITLADLPTVTTSPIYNITSESATCGGKVTTDGGTPVTARGICWGTSQNPTISNQHSFSGNGTGNFTSDLTNLTPGTTYYVRAYATNNIGTAYGSQISFSTNAVLPTVTTMNISDITCNAAIGGGNIVSTGGATIAAKGICWDTSQNPTIINSHTSNGTSMTPVSYTSNLTNLTPNTTYYVRAYATNSVGTAYGESVSFITDAIIPPTVNTISVNNITDYSVSCSYSTYNCAEVSEHGICWGTQQNPTINDSHISEGSGTGSFTSNITGLSAGTTYYIRAYATNSVGISYGTTISFTTLHPTITTTEISNITRTSATSGGTIISNSGAIITSRGVCWNTSPNPTINDNYTTDSSGTGSFSSVLTGLSAGVTYYVRAYIIYDAGTAYGNQLSFTTSRDGLPCQGSETVSDYEGHIYNTVTIGTQCWMKENLRTTHYSNGSSISWSSQTSTTTAYYYYPDNNSSNVSNYGYLYNRPAVMHGSQSSDATPSGIQGICPTGWHVPSKAEWIQLTYYVSSVNEYTCNDDSSYIAKALAATTGWNSSSVSCSVGSDINTNNTIGFSALPAGVCTAASFGLCDFTHFGYYAYYWSSSESNTDGGWGFQLAYHMAAGIVKGFPKDEGISVRCLRDESPMTFPTVTTESISNITSISATCSGNVIASSTNDIITRGFCWGTFPNPTISDAHTVNNNGTGGYSSNLNNLSMGTTYYVRAYATHNVGTTYGNQISFTTSNDGDPCLNTATLTDYDGNIYNTVIIGSQCWMKENLRTTHYSNNTTIPTGTTFSTTTPYRYAPNNDEANVPTYGYLYNWTAVMHGTSSSTANHSGVQGICPNGWHVPSDAEWIQLTNYVSRQNEYVCGNDTTKIAKALAATTGWNSYINYCAVGNNIGTNNATGFSFLPSGYYGNGVNYYGYGSYAYFWSATGNNNNHAYYGYIAYCAPYVFKGNIELYHGFSVRCIRDEENSWNSQDGQPCPSTPNLTDIDGNVYNTVQIGQQCWMKENLRTTHYANNVTIPAGTTFSTITPYRYAPNNDMANVPAYGYLYNWAAVMQGATSSTANPSGVQGICPNGWHVPSLAEWEQLEEYVGSQSEFICGNNNTKIAKALSATFGWNSSPIPCAPGNNTETNNTTNFSALPAGGAFIEYSDIGYETNFWSTTEGYDCAFRYVIHCDWAQIGSSTSGLAEGLSVRCVKD